MHQLLFGYLYVQVFNTFFGDDFYAREATCACQLCSDFEGEVNGIGGMTVTVDHDMTAAPADLLQNLRCRVRRGPPAPRNCPGIDFKDRHAVRPRQFRGTRKRVSLKNPIQSLSRGGLVPRAGFIEPRLFFVEFGHKIKMPDDVAIRDLRQQGNGVVVMLDEAVRVTAEIGSYCLTNPVRAPVNVIIPAPVKTVETVAGILRGIRECRMNRANHIIIVIDWLVRTEILLDAAQNQNFARVFQPEPFNFVLVLARSVKTHAVAAIICSAAVPGETDDFETAVDGRQNHFFQRCGSVTKSCMRMVVIWYNVHSRIRSSFLTCSIVSQDWGLIQYKPEPARKGRNRGKRMAQRGKNILIGLAAAVTAVCIAITAVVLFKPLYYYDIEKLNIPETSGVSAEACRENFDILIDYNRIGGPDRLEFKDFGMSREGRIHFEEVKEIFLATQWIAIFGTVFAAAMIAKRRDFGWMRAAAAESAILCVIVLAAAAADWNKTFAMVHAIFFRNDYWLFNPATDPIIKILPDAYFLHCGILIILLAAVINILLELIYRKKRKQYGRNHI